METFLKLLILLILSFGSNNNAKLFAQSVIYRTQLPKQIEETSGLEFFKGGFLTHNDSGGKPTLYEFNETGNILEGYNIEGVENNDWEDIAQDENYLYISDSGNNKGERQDLNILIVDPKRDFKKVGTIAFNYRNQQNFDKRKNIHLMQKPL